MAHNISLFLKIFILTLSAIPFCIVANKFVKYLIAQGFPPIVLATVSTLFLLSFLGITVILCKRSKEQISNWHFYAFSIFATTSAVDIGFALEQDGYISGEYLIHGEPYLFCPFGKAFIYFDGFGIYPIYLYMIYAISNKKSYRNIGLYWSGVLGTPLMVLSLGILWGKHGLFPASIYNLFYMVVPFVIAWKLLQQRPTLETKTSSGRLVQRPADLFLVALLVICLILTVLRGVAVVDNNIGIAKYYIEKIEPFLVMTDPSPFLKIQMLVYLFYFTPIYVLSIYALVEPGCMWMPDLTLFHAGTMVQCQFVLMKTALDSSIPSQFQLPNALEAKIGFWSVNLLIALVPHLLLFRCYLSNTLFCKQLLHSKSEKPNSKSK